MASWLAGDGEAREFSRRSRLLTRGGGWLFCDVFFCYVLFGGVRGKKNEKREFFLPSLFRDLPCLCLFLPSLIDLLMLLFVVDLSRKSEGIQ